MRRRTEEETEITADQRTETREKKTGTRKKRHRRR